MIYRVTFPLSQRQFKHMFYSSLRLALTGNPNGPPLGVIMECLGREKTLERLERAIREIRYARAAEERHHEEEFYTDSCFIFDGSNFTAV